MKISNVSSKRFRTRSGTSSQWPCLSWARRSVERFFISFFCSVEMFFICFFLLCGEVFYLFFFALRRGFFICFFALWRGGTKFFHAFLSSSKAVNWNCLEKSTASQLPLGPLKESRNLEMQFESNAQVLSRSNKAAGLEEFRLDLMTLCFLER